MLLISVYGLIALFVTYHVRWRTQPYNYPTFVYDYEKIEATIVPVVGLVLLPALAILVVFIATEVLNLFYMVLNLEDLSTKRKRKFVIKNGGIILMVLICVGILLFPILGYVHTNIEGFPNCFHMLTILGLLVYPQLYGTIT